MRVFLSNLGCKLNQAELEALARRFVAAGHALAGSLEEADLHVVNSCTVTHAAARDSRKTARRGARRNPRLRTVLTGCHVAAAPEEAAALAGVDLVVPNDRKEELVEHVHAAFPEAVPDAGEPVHPGGGPHHRSGGLHAAVPVPYVPLAFGNARALVKIEDGCNMRCAFCIIPFTRGSQRSRPAGEVVREVAGLAAGGFAEIVVTGVQISSYRDEQTGLFELVSRLLDETAAPQLRLTSIAPWEFDRRLLGLVGDGRLRRGRLCRHFHLSLQSGCDATLRRMRRPYRAAGFASLAAEIRAAVPGVALTTDVIAGFPGETDAEFADSLEFCRQIGFARLHAFPYSARPGTAAAAMPDQVPPPVLRERMGALLEAARESRQDFERRQIGSRVDVLWEHQRRGRWLGTTDNYLSVSAAGVPVARPGSLQPVRIAAPAGGELLAAVPVAEPAAARA